MTGARLESRQPQGLVHSLAGSCSRLFWEVLVLLGLKDKERGIYEEANRAVKASPASKVPGLPS